MTRQCIAMRVLHQYVPIIKLLNNQAGRHNPGLVLLFAFLLCFFSESELADSPVAVYSNRNRISGLVFVFCILKVLIARPDSAHETNISHAYPCLFRTASFYYICIYAFRPPVIPGINAGYFFAAYPYKRPSSYIPVGFELINNRFASFIGMENPSP